MKVKSTLGPRVVKLCSNPACSDNMGDVNDTRPSNVRPRPLGEVKAESVYFDSPTTPVFRIEASERHAAQHNDYRMNRLHENLITTALIGDVAAANAVPIARKSSTAHGITGSSFSAVQLISSLVTPISRTISIPQPRANNTNGAILRINTAPSGFGKDKSMCDPCPSPVNSESAVTDSTTMSSRSTKSTSTWGEYKRQISTAKRKEMCRRITELSKCDAVDMSDHVTRGSDSRPIMILSQMPQREKEYDALVARADSVLQKKKALPSVFLTKQKRPGSLVRDMNVFSKALKNKPGYQIGQIDDVVVGKSMDPNYTDRQDDDVSEATSDSGSVWSKGSAGSRRYHPDMTSTRSNTGFYDIYSGRLGHPRPVQSKMSQLGPQTSRYRDKVLKLQGKSLPRLQTAGARKEEKENRGTPSPAATPRSVPQRPQDARLMREINAKCDKLQRQISISLMAPDKVWSQHGYFNTHQPAPMTGPLIPQQQRRQPIHAIYRSFQRMHETKTLSSRQKTTSSACDNKMSSPKCEINSEHDMDDAVPSPPSDDENNNNIATKTFHLTELDDTDFVESDSDDQAELSESEDGDITSVTLLKLSESDPMKQASGTAKYQGPTSRISEDEAGSQFHVVNGETQVSQREAYKILKALDKDVYVEYEHKKYRRSGTHGSLGNPDNPRVHFLKVKVSDTN